ncbi:MAG: hypothetical protein ACR2KJ_06000 [Jatrophihabitans sp.]
MTALARFVIARRRWVLLAWLVLAIAGGFAVPRATAALTYDFGLPGQPGYETNLGHHDTLSGELRTARPTPQQHNAGLGLDRAHPSGPGLLTHPTSAEAPFRLPAFATAGRTSIAASSGTCPLKRMRAW